MVLAPRDRPCGHLRSVQPQRSRRVRAIGKQLDFAATGEALETKQKIPQHPSWVLPTAWASLSLGATPGYLEILSRGCRCQARKHAPREKGSCLKPLGLREKHTAAFLRLCSRTGIARGFFCRRKQSENNGLARRGGGLTQTREESGRLSGSTPARGRTAPNPRRGPSPKRYVKRPSART